MSPLSVSHYFALCTDEVNGRYLAVGLDALVHKVNRESPHHPWQKRFMCTCLRYLARRGRVR